MRGWPKTGKSKKHNEHWKITKELYLDWRRTT
jgi:hypothetical protein